MWIVNLNHMHWEKFTWENKMLWLKTIPMKNIFNCLKVAPNKIFITYQGKYIFMFPL
jgi:hypothetical protein